MLAIRDLRLDYDGSAALGGVDLDVRQGEAVALVGANGAGKSSLLAAVSGLHRPIGGSIVFEGQELARLPPHRITPLGLALVPEGRRLFPHLSVRRNLMLGAYHQSSREGMGEYLGNLFELFPILRARLDQRAGTLSGGEQQMVAVARALMSRPRLLMLDEPSLGVAPIVVSRMFEALARIRDEGTTILLVEQNLQLALEFAARGYVLQTGRVIMSGPTEDLLSSDEVRRAYLGV
ncbi:MAG: ABC transporter ATP-binding protein [Acidimicrobiales bacterium]